jgi:RNA polymerase sigma factor (sigma-70 family)
MAMRPLGEVLRHLQQDPRTDGQLLEAFLRRRDEPALAALIRRHGPMVWGVCRRLLRNYHDAEDAFQATFCVLVQKGAAIRDRERVANWLYGVAHQTAVRMRTSAAKRAARERQVTALPELPAAEHDCWDDLRPLLDHALNGLPDKYRVLVVLCDLEGKTRKEVARQLTLPEGTVAGRLARARVLLARRLHRIGLALSAGMLGIVLSAEAASASLPEAVVSSTIRTVTQLSLGQSGAASTGVIALTKGVLNAMLMTKLKVTALLLLVAGTAGVGVATFAQAGGVLNASSAAPRSGPAASPGKGRPQVTTKQGPTLGKDLAKIKRQMSTITDRLAGASGGEQTQKLQGDVLLRLDAIINELDKQEQKPPQQTDLVAELRLLRAMQNRIKVRTENCSTQFEGETVPPPETAKDPKEQAQWEALRRELKELAARQERVAALMHALATEPR